MGGRRLSLIAAVTCGLALPLAFAQAAEPQAPPPSRVELKPYEGPALPPFILGRLDDADPLPLADLKGHAVAVHFFATWCEPCREELPALQAFARRMEGRPFRVVLVNVAEGEGALRRFMERPPFDGSFAPLHLVRDADRAVARAWGVFLLPTTIVLDAGLTPRLMAAGEVDWTSPETAKAVTRLLPGEDGRPPAQTDSAPEADRKAGDPHSKLQTAAPDAVATRETIP